MNVFAQTTKQVKGAVVDKNGNPLPGAMVEATGGAESTVTDADGTFSIEVSQWLKSLTATYNGMRKKKMDIRGRNEVLFELKQEPKNQWFVNLITDVQVDPGAPSFGLMFGKMGDWGWYAKLLFTLEKWETFYDRDIEGPAITAGVIKRIKKDWFAYGGLGYGTVIYEKWYSWIYSPYTRSDSGGKLAIGTLARYRHCVFNVGLSVVANFDDINWGPQFGFGYAF